ncbi:hypothetical protein [Cytobacillus firmus]|uniref:hypothetical protein n=1 Tax=Cytobacillus firmus TaxID=1399 RepID=UPI0021ADFB4D|nr:hypothetical protein [Cytobacillus firmus]
MNNQYKAGTIANKQFKAVPAVQKQVKTGPIMAALLVAGFVGLFSETAFNIALGGLSFIFSVDATVIQ